MKALNMGNNNQEIERIVEINNLKKKFTSLDERVKTFKNYDDALLRKNISILNKNIGIMNNQLKQFQPNIDGIRLDVEALKTRIPELRKLARSMGKVELTPELEKAIQDLKHTKGLSYRQIAIELGIKKHLVEKALKPRDNQKKPEEQQPYIG